MASKIRTIKPEFFTHYALYKAEADSCLPLRVAFAGLWTVADREGRFKWDPPSMKPCCLPHDPIDFTEVMEVLAERGFIVRYVVDGKEYGCIPSWKEHQVINNREPHSKIPPPLLAKHNRDASQQLRDAASVKGNGMEGNGNNASDDIDHPPAVDPLKEDLTSPAIDPEKVFIELPCTLPQGEFFVTKDYVAKMKKLFPAVDVEGEIRKAAAWLINNPRNVKT
jgi:hypothetical protein